MLCQPKGDRVRLFVALEIPEEVREALRGFLAEMRQACGGGRWARVEGMHVTLKFLGETTEEGRARIELALAGIELAAPLALEFRGTGFFPNAKRPRVFWAGVEGPTELGRLAAMVEERLGKVGFAKEEREFRAHLTLARFDSPREVEALHAELAKRESPVFGATVAEEFHLYESELLRGGARYKKLRTFSFVKPERAGAPGGTP